MPIYHVDTFLGSDANTGASWAQAWKTLYPLKAIYGGAGTIYDVEVRIAKTTPYETNRAITFLAPSNGTYANCYGQARPLAGYRKAVIPDYPGTVARPFNWGGTLYGTFFGSSESTNPAYRPAGTFKFRVSAPALTSGRALRWLVADGALASFDCLEVAGSIYRHNNEYTPATGVTVTLQLCADADGLTVLRTYSIPLGDTVLSTRLALLGAGDLPNGVASAFIVIDNPLNETVHVDMSSMYAVLPQSHPNYVGLRLIYVPNDHMGTPLTPVTTSGVYTYFNGIDGPGIDSYRVSQGESPRTWTTHPWTSWPYPVAPLFPVASVVGSAEAPIKVYGGWNTATNTIDGLTAIDAANLRWFNFVSRVSIDLRNLAVAFKRAGLPVNNFGMSGIMEEGQVSSKRLVNCRAENVHLPAGGAGVVGQQIGFYVSSYSGDSLLVTPRQDDQMDKHLVSVKGCTTALSPPFFGKHLVGEVTDCTFGTIPPDAPRGTVVENCVFINTRTGAGGIGDHIDTPVVLRNCDIVATFISNSWGNESACAPRGWMENCRMWGAFTGPRSHEYVATDCVWRPLPGVLGQVCGSGASFDGLSAPHGESIYNHTTSMFARTGLDAEPITLTLKNSNIQAPFASITSASTTYDYVGHTVTLDNVTLHKTDASAGAAFLSARLKARSVTLVGAWDSLLSGAIRGADVDGLVVTDAATKLVNNYRFAGPATGWGRVASYFRNILHPSGLAGFLGTPVVGFSSAAAWFHTVAGEMWASDVMKVTRDATVAHTGVSSWKCTTLTYVGSHTRGSFLLGALPVVAGVPIICTAWVRRSSYDVLGGLFLRPMGTRTFATPGVATVDTLHEITALQSPTQSPEQWVQVSIAYTPTSTGLVELHFGMRGLLNNTVWLDSLKVTQ